MRTISCVAKEIAGGRRMVVDQLLFRGIFPFTTTPILELLPCLLKRHTHPLLPTTSQSHFDIHPATWNFLLQTPHDIRIALQFSVVGDVNGCLCGDVGDKLELGAGVDVLKFSDRAIVEIILDPY